MTEPHSADAGPPDKPADAQHSDHRSDELDAVDGLVRSYLEAEVARTDADSLIARMKQTPAPAQDPPKSAKSDRKRRKAEKKARAAQPQRLRQAFSPRSLRRAAVWFAGMAAVLVVSFLAFQVLAPRPASAATMLRGVQVAHRAAVDRCYQVQYSPDARSWDGKNKLDGPSHSVLWTRGSQFWSDCALGDVRLSLGREPDGGLWLSTARDKGVRFTNDESQLPPEVAFLCAVNSMSIPKLIDDVLADFELQVETPEAGQEGRAIIWATLRSGRSHPLLSDAMLEIDVRERVVSRLILWTERDSKPKGTVTFTLVGASPQPDEVYLLGSHVADDAQIEVQTLGGKKPQRSDKPTKKPAPADEPPASKADGPNATNATRGS